MPLGAHVHHDSRSWDYQAELAPELVSVRHFAHGLPFNQAKVGSCTAEALTGACNTNPNIEPGNVPYAQQMAITLYIKESTNEGYPYPAYDPGGSGLAVCQAGVQLGMISSYTHAFGAQNALLALVLRPIISGFNWYDSMDTPDENGIVDIPATARVRGRHETMGHMLDVPNEVIWFWNSWGRDWGMGGRYGMRFATYERLLSEQGDATVPMI
jgi:hypothetical protein